MQASEMQARRPRQGRAGAPAPSVPPALIVRDLGLCPFERTWEAMRAFTDARDASAADECWLLEHPAVFTLGQAGRAEHLLAPDATPVVRTDRGGQVTWHGPGQLLAYLLMDTRRAGVHVRRLVSGLEASVIRCLAAWGLKAERMPGAPGVYVGGAKIAALGLRLRRGCSYHGLSLNVCNDLAPFARINPCGHAGLPVTSLAALGVPTSIQEAKAGLAQQIAAEFGHQAHWQEPSAPGNQEPSAPGSQEPSVRSGLPVQQGRSPEWRRPSALGSASAHG